MGGQEKLQSALYRCGFKRKKYPSLSLRWHWALISTALRVGTVIQRCLRGQVGAGRQRCSGLQPSIGCGAFAAIGERKKPAKLGQRLGLDLCHISLPPGNNSKSY